MSTPLLPILNAPAPQVFLAHLDDLWFQAAGTLCNLECRHCFISCSPHNDSFGFLDVAFFRVRQVRHAMAEQQFAQARVALAKKDFRAAYIAFATALRRDPDNVEGRLEAAAFPVFKPGPILAHRTASQLAGRDCSVDGRTDLDGEAKRR